MHHIFYVLTFILKLLGQLIAFIIVQYGTFKFAFNKHKLHLLKISYLKNPTENTHLRLELESIRQELAYYKSANKISKQLLNKLTNKKSCLCTRLGFILTKVTNNLSTKQLEKIAPFSYRTLSGWLRDFAKYGIMGIIPQTQIPWSVKFRTPHEVVKQVWQIHLNNPAFGKLRIAQILWRLCIFISPNTVKNILNRPKPRPSYSKKPRKPVSPETHDRTITASKTNNLWSIDLTPTMIGPYQCSILAIIDHFSRKLIHINFFFGEPGAEWIINNLKYAIYEYACPKSIITDNGNQFIDNEFKKFIHAYNIDHRKGKVKKPYSNGKVERFFLSLKSEALRLFPLLTENRIGKLIRDYHIYYNKYRPNQAINGATPDEVYYSNEIPVTKPPKTNKIIQGTIKRTRFCEGVIEAYSLN